MGPFESPAVVDKRSDRFVSTIVIAAAVVAAVRLAKEESISRATPRIVATIADSVHLARAILDRVLKG